LTVIEGIDELISGETYTGYKTAELGNETDITSLTEEMKKWREYETKYNLCLDSNRNFSTYLMMAEEDSGYKANFTLCDTERNNLQNQMSLKDIVIADKDEEIDDLKSGKFLWLGLGILGGWFFFAKGIPYFKGRDTPKDPANKQFPANAGY